MRPYSTDFRLKVVRAYERGEGSQRQLARVFGVSLGFLQGLLQRYRRTGSVQPQPHGGGKPSKIRSQDAIVARLHGQQPDASLAEKCARLAVESGGSVSRATMSRALQRLGFTHKKRRSAPRSKTRPKAGPSVRRTRKLSMR
jgi:transposase